MPRTRRCWSWVLVVPMLLLLGATPLGAQAPDDKARAAGRVLVQEGDTLFKKGDFTQALDRFTRAYEFVGGA